LFLPCRIPVGGMSRSLIVCLLLAHSVTCLAETAYVTDMLRLGLHHAEDTSDRAFRSLASGTELQVLERVPNYARVSTDDGQQGWVKSAYLVSDPPARLRVAEMRAELQHLRGRLGDAESALARSESQVRELRRQSEARDASSKAARDTLDRLQRENTAYEDRFERYRGSLPLSWVAGALAVSLLAGFLAGLWFVDFRIRRRHGGFRIY
jgi:SH3 domain protein